MSIEEGFVYVATGERYISEAAASARTLRQHHPKTPICLITDAPRGEPFWDDLVLLEKPAFGFRDKIQMQRAPYARCVFLDTDTTVIGDLSPLFTILKRYDVCGVQISEGQEYVMEGDIPAAYPEMNSGVVGFRHGEATREFFALWEHYYKEFRSLNYDNYYHWANVGDQKSLRAALWHSNVRHFGVGAEFNFIPFKSELASLPISVLHTRATGALKPLAARLNSHIGRRVYFPSIDAMVFDSMTGPEVTRLTKGTSILLLRALGRTLIPRRLRDGMREHRSLRGWLFGNHHQSPVPPGGLDKWELPPPKTNGLSVD